MNDCSKDLNQADEGDLLRAEVSDEVIEAASMALMQGVELTLKKRGYPPIAEMKAKWRGQNR